MTILYDVRYVPAEPDEGGMWDFSDTWDSDAQTAADALAELLRYEREHNGAEPAGSQAGREITLTVWRADADGERVDEAAGSFRAGEGWAT